MVSAGEIELTREQIVGDMTATVSVEKAMRSIRWRMKVARIFFTVGFWIIGCNVVFEGFDE